MVVWAFLKNFAQSFIETTKGWSPEEVYGEGEEDDEIHDSDDEGEDDDDDAPPKPYSRANSKSNNDDDADKGAHWVDDREEPIYVRADSLYSEKEGPAIDKMLEDHIPEHLDNREPFNDENNQGDNNNITLAWEGWQRNKKKHIIRH